MGKFLNSWIQVQIHKFLRTVSSYRIRYAEKNLAGITFRELGVTKNKKNTFLTFQSVKLDPPLDKYQVKFTPKNIQYSWVMISIIG